MTDQYQYWKAALAGDKPKMFTDDPQPGFYRCGIYEKQPNKARKRVGWKPVALFMQTENGFPQSGLMAAVGDQIVIDRDKINELWSYVAGNPISEEWYRAVTRGEPWPDSHEDKPKRDPESEAAIEQAFIAEGDRRNAAESLLTEDAQLALRMIEAKAFLPKYKGIDSDEMASKARSLQQRFLDIRSDANNSYETANRPLLNQQKTLRETWFPLRDGADEASNEIRTELGKWEDTKRKAARLAQEAAEKAAREHTEATRKAAEANQPAPPPPEPAKSNVPAPASQIRGGAGRAASVSVAVFVTAIDEDAVFKQFKGNPELTALLTALAQKAIRAGIPVPGATTEERSVVR